MRIFEKGNNSRIQFQHFLLHGTIQTKGIAINLYLGHSTHCVFPYFTHTVRKFMIIKYAILICKCHPLMAVILITPNRHEINWTRNTQRTTNINDKVWKFPATTCFQLRNFRSHMRKAGRNGSSKYHSSFTNWIEQTTGCHNRVFFIKYSGCT